MIFGSYGALEGAVGKREHKAKCPGPQCNT